MRAPNPLPGTPMSTSLPRIKLGVDPFRGGIFELAVPTDISHHVTLLGVTGAGKTTTAERIAEGALAHGYGVLIVDAKGGGLRDTARALARRAAVRHVEVVPGAAGSLGYNPCANGSPSQVADKLVSAFAHGPNAEIYRLIAQEAIAVVVATMQALGEAVTIGTLRRELDPVRMVGLSHRARGVDAALGHELADLAMRGRLTNEALAGMRARLGALVHGVYGELFDSSGPQLDLATALGAPGVTYIGLPAMAVTTDTALIARVLIQDLKQAGYQRLQQTDPPSALLILDEFAALDDPAQICDLLRQAREARIATVVSTQHLPDPITGHALRASLLGVGLLIAHRCWPDDAEAVAAVVGTEKGSEVTQQVSGGSNTGNASVRRVDRYIVNPNAIKQFATGEAVVLAQVGQRRAATILVSASPGGSNASSE